MSEKYVISWKQWSILKGFFTHCWSVCHEGVKSDYGFYAEQLDEAGVPWHVQNIVAELADHRENAFKNLKVLAQKKISGLVFDWL